MKPILRSLRPMKSCVINPIIAGISSCCEMTRLITLLTLIIQTVDCTNEHICAVHIHTYVHPDICLLASRHHYDIQMYTCVCVCVYNITTLSSPCHIHTLLCFIFIVACHLSHPVTPAYGCASVFVIHMSQHSHAHQPTHQPTQMGASIEECGLLNALLTDRMSSLTINFQYCCFLSMQRKNVNYK